MRSPSTCRIMLCAFVCLMLASCSDALKECLPVALAGNLKLETVEPLWQRELYDSLLVRVMLAESQTGNLAPTAVFIDSTKRRTAVLPLEQFLSTPIYLIWVNDETQQVSSSSGPYITIHAIGYIPQELFPNKKMFTAGFIFQPAEEHPLESGNEIFYRVSAFQNGVIWFPIADFDLSNHRYLFEIAIDTEESLATNSAIPGDAIYREWDMEFQPAINIEDRPIKLSQLSWIDYTSDIECVTLR